MTSELAIQATRGLRSSGSARSVHEVLLAGDPYAAHYHLRAVATTAQQTLIDAPIEEVWDLISDPVRFPEWNDELEVTGVPTRIEEGSTFRQTGQARFGLKATTTFEVEESDEGLREIKLRCQASGFYSHWLLTEAQGDTFAHVEMGVEPHGLKQRMWALPLTETELRRSLNRSIDGLQRVLAARS